MSWINRESQNENSDREKDYPFARWVSWLFLVASILLLIYTYYRAEITFQGGQQSYYFKYYLILLTVILFWGIVLRLREEIRANIVTVVTSLVVGLYMIEGGLFFLGIGQYYNVDSATTFELGIEYDTRTKLEVIEDLIEKRVDAVPTVSPSVFVKEIGDGTLSYFSSAVDASNCAIHLQESTYDEKHLNIRAGLHIGDIVFDGDDVFGEGVNIASRLESLSPIGGVCVSKNIYDELENKKEFNGTSLGLQSLKGVGRLLEVYTLKGDKLKDPDIKEFEETQVQKHTDNEVPSIAIIPFDNKGADEDIFYAYGISSDLISDVASAGLIRVASLKEIEELGDLPFKEKARKLSVRYVSNGTLWKMGEIFQLSIELYDIKDSKVVWSDRWQENWDNLPLIKSNLSDGLLKALDTKPKPLKRLETIDTKAYELYLKAKHRYEKRDSKEDTRLARGLL